MVNATPLDIWIFKKEDKDLSHVLWSVEPRPMGRSYRKISIEYKTIYSLLFEPRGDFLFEDHCLKPKFLVYPGQTGQCFLSPHLLGPVITPVFTCYLAYMRARFTSVLPLDPLSTLPHEHLTVLFGASSLWARPLMTVACVYCFDC